MEILLPENCIINQKEITQSKVIIINGSDCKKLDDLYNQLNEKLLLPDYFGRNLDALYDCMTDFSWIEEQDIIIALVNYDKFLNLEESSVWEDFVFLFYDVIEFWNEEKDEYGLDEEKASDLKNVGIVFEFSSKAIKDLDSFELGYSIKQIKI